MNIQVKDFSELTLEELYALLRLRAEVFVVEQDCPYQDLDNRDQQAVHVLVWESGELLACLRVIPPGLVWPETVIGRVVTRTHGKGHGRVLMEEGIRVARERFGSGAIRIGAQCQASGFYARFGFRRDESQAQYLEDGIPHIQMVLEGRNTE